MKTNGGFLITKVKQLNDRIFEKILAKKNVDAFNGPQGRILYVLWQEDGVPIKTISEKSGLAITSLTTMLERTKKRRIYEYEKEIEPVTFANYSCLAVTLYTVAGYTAVCGAVFCNGNIHNY